MRKQARGADKGVPRRSVTDVAGRKETAITLRRLNRRLQALRTCAQLIARATDEDVLLNEICRAIVDIGGYRMAWIGFPEHDAARSVRPVAQCGIENGYLEQARITWADTERGRGPTGHASRVRSRTSPTISGMLPGATRPCAGDTRVQRPSR